ncbi:hypothetical protein D9M70_535370 [compost metagenome]
MSGLSLNTLSVFLTHNHASAAASKEKRRLDKNTHRQFNESIITPPMAGEKAGAINAIAIIIVEMRWRSWFGKNAYTSAWPTGINKPPAIP